ncbi:MAG: DEAD/DEAH box helicase [Deltaproteobacteria bacterium]|nr:DEAD/DEAH box helicase [Deltaproteobacteria bacterium]
MKFDILDLNPDILKGVKDAGFEHCTPIQEQALPECLAGKDVIAQSQTGSGKTAVFLLSIFSRVLAAGPDPTGRPRALVMVPTRELATQVIDDATKLGVHIPFRSVAVYGGVEYDKQINALKKGVDLVVATPGRMIDLHKSKTLSLDNIEIFVIDEADRMFDMGFAPDIMYIAGRLPKKKPRQTMLFSATIDSNVRRLASRYMSPDPVIIEIEPEQITVNSIDQKVIYVSNEEKLPVLMALLKRAEVERSIIFTNMKRTAEMLGWKLAANGFPAKVLTGDLSQERRQKVIEGMKSGKIKILVATDVAARGLHIEDISHVINYDLPDDAANYVHRIGRTARAGKSGKAYSLACEDHVLNLPEIEKYIERKIESEWIEDSEMVKDTAPRFNERPGREKPFERRDKKHEGQRGGRRPGERKGREGRPHHHAEKKTDAPVQPAPGIDRPRPQHEKRADAAGGKGAPAGQKPPAQERPAGQERGQEGFRPGRPQRRGQRPDKKRRFPEARKETGPGQRPQTRQQSEKPVQFFNDRPAEKHAPAAIKPEAKPQHHAVERNEAGPKEKSGILKRFLKFLKKSR